MEDRTPSLICHPRLIAEPGFAVSEFVAEVAYSSCLSPHRASGSPKFVEQRSQRETGRQRGNACFAEASDGRRAVPRSNEATPSSWCATRPPTHLSDQSSMLAYLLCSALVGRHKTRRGVRDIRAAHRRSDVDMQQELRAAVERAIHAYVADTLWPNRQGLDSCERCELDVRGS